MSNPPVTIARVGVFNGNLEEAVRRYSPAARRVDFGLGNTVKFGLYEEKPAPYLLLVSQQISKKIATVEGVSYNAILTVSSRSQKTNRQIAAQFEERTGILLTDAPQSLASMMQGCGMAFVVFSRVGMDRAMEGLRTL